MMEYSTAMSMDYLSYMQQPYTVCLNTILSERARLKEHIVWVHCDFFTSWGTREAQEYWSG